MKLETKPVVERMKRETSGRRENIPGNTNVTRDSLGPMRRF